MERGHQIRIADAIEALGASGGRFTDLWRRGTLVVELYRPGDIDPQTPHDQDELYVVVEGSGRFEVDGVTETFGPGDVLFAAAGVEHRFVDFTPNLSTWVIFYGPKGGEDAAG